jgi:hypothetical protein
VFWVIVGKQWVNILSQNATICDDLRFATFSIASLKVPYLRGFCPFSAPFLNIPMWSWRELVAKIGVGCIHAGLRVMH